MKVDTYQSRLDSRKFLTVRAGTRLGSLPVAVTTDPDLQFMTPMLLDYDLLLTAPLDGFDYLRVTHQIQIAGYAIHSVDTTRLTNVERDRAA